MKTGPGMALLGFEWLSCARRWPQVASLVELDVCPTLPKLRQTSFRSQEAVLADESLYGWWCERLFPFVLVFLEGFKFRVQRKTFVMCIFMRSDFWFRMLTGDSGLHTDLRQDL